MYSATRSVADPRSPPPPSHPAPRSHPLGSRACFATGQVAIINAVAEVVLPESDSVALTALVQHPTCSAGTACRGAVSICWHSQTSACSIRTTLNTSAPTRHCDSRCSSAHDAPSLPAFCSVFCCRCRRTAAGRRGMMACADGAARAADGGIPGCRVHRGEQPLVRVS